MSAAPQDLLVEEQEPTKDNINSTTQQHPRPPVKNLLAHNRMFVCYLCSASAITFKEPLNLNTSASSS